MSGSAGVLMPGLKRAKTGSYEERILFLSPISNREKQRFRNSSKVADLHQPDHLKIVLVSVIVIEYPIAMLAKFRKRET